MRSYVGNVSRGCKDSKRWEEYELDPGYEDCEGYEGYEQEPQVAIDWEGHEACEHTIEFKPHSSIALKAGSPMYWTQPIQPACPDNLVPPPTGNLGVKSQDIWYLLPLLPEIWGENCRISRAGHDLAYRRVGGPDSYLAHTGFSSIHIQQLSRLP